MLFPLSQKTPPYTLGVSIKRFKQSSSVLSITRELRRKTEKNIPKHAMDALYENISLQYEYLYNVTTMGKYQYILYSANV